MPLIILLACMIVLGTTLSTSEVGDASREAQQLHRTLKQLDLGLNQVHSVVQYDQLKQRYTEHIEQQKVASEKKETQRKRDIELKQMRNERLQATQAEQGTVQLPEIPLPPHLKRALKPEKEVQPKSNAVAKPETKEPQIQQPSLQGQLQGQAVVMPLRSYDDYLQNGPSITPLSLQGQSSSIVKFVMQENVQEVFIPGEIDVESFTGLYHTKTGHVLINLEGKTVEEIMAGTKDELFKNIDELQIVKPNQINGQDGQAKVDAEIQSQRMKIQQKALEAQKMYEQKMQEIIPEVQKPAQPAQPAQPVQPAQLAQPATLEQEEPLDLNKIDILDDEQEAESGSVAGRAGSKVYQPFFPQHPKEFWKQDTNNQKKSEPQTEGFLSIIEEKRLSYQHDRTLLKDLSTAVQQILVNPSQDPDAMLSQTDFSDLVKRGVLTHNQAFLVYSLFHTQRMKHKASLASVDNEIYVFFGLVPVVLTLNYIMAALVAALVCLTLVHQSGKQPIYVQATMLGVQLQLAFFLDSLNRGQGHQILGAFAGFCYMLLEFCADSLALLSVQDSELYGFKVIRDERDKKRQSAKSVIFLTIYNVVLYRLCGIFKHQEVYAVCSLAQGYLCYRLWAYIQKRCPSKYTCFPFYNLSSAVFLLAVTLVKEGHQIIRLISSLFSNEVSGSTRAALVALNEHQMQDNSSLFKATSLLLTAPQRMTLVFQIAFVLATFHKYYEFKEFIELLNYKKAMLRCKESTCQKVDLYRAELVRPLHSQPSEHSIEEPLDTSAQPSSGSWLPFLWGAFFFAGLMLIILGSMLQNVRLSCCGVYTTFELASEIFDAFMCWSERRLPLRQLLIELSFANEEREAALKDENGRELPQWLREAEENEIAERDKNLPNWSLKTILVQYGIHYSFKAVILYYFFGQNQA